MSKKLFVGNLPHEIRDPELKELFSEFGTVVSAQVIIDKFTERSKGFGFVVMGTAEEAQSAIENLDNREVNNRAIRVNIAKPPVNRDRGGFGGDRNGGGGAGRGDRNERSGDRGDRNGGNRFGGGKRY